MNLGGAIDAVEREPATSWSLVARRAKSRFDMRPVKTVARYASNCCGQGKRCTHKGDVCCYGYHQMSSY